MRSVSPTSRASGVDIVALANAIIFDQDNQKIRLGLVWRTQPVVLIFLRHFACGACRAHAHQVWSERDRYESSGARIVFVGNGAPIHIKDFKESLGIQNSIVYTDPTLLSFKAAGLKRGLFATLRPKSIVESIKLEAQGFTHQSYEPSAGDRLQVGGVLAVKSDGRVVYQFVSEYVGNFPPDADVESIRLATSGDAVDSNGEQAS